MCRTVQSALVALWFFLPLFFRDQLFPPSLYGLIISFGIDAAINYRKPQRGARQQDGKNESG